MTIVPQCVCNQRGRVSNGWLLEARLHGRHSTLWAACSDLLGPSCCCVPPPSSQFQALLLGRICMHFFNGLPVNGVHGRAGLLASHCP